MNIGLFNFVDIHVYQAIFGHADIHIEVTERWYLWPMPVFEIADRNFNEWYRHHDFNRVNYGMRVRQDNFRGRDETLILMLVFGYSQRLGLYYEIPYINRKQNIGLTCGVFGTRNHEVAYDSKDNKLEFYKNSERFMRNDLSAYIKITKRKGIHHFYSTFLDYRVTSIDDTVALLNPNYFVNNGTIQRHLGLTWSYRYDMRDYQSYAQRGFLFELEVEKTGLGLFKNEPDLMSITTGIRGYKPFGERWDIAGLLRGKVSQREDAPFFNQKALGYLSDYIRGYDYYVLNGQDWMLCRSNLRYSLLKTRVYELPMFNTDKFRKIPVAFYLNAFADAGYVTDHAFGYKNPLSNQWQYSYGFGLDYVTYYDLVFRFEYAWNKMHETGFFFHIGTAL
jgi:outer membrane protein assembly factor BamA